MILQIVVSTVKNVYVATTTRVERGGDSNIAWTTLKQVWQPHVLLRVIIMMQFEYEKRRMKYILGIYRQLSGYCFLAVTK